jgi:hypothetical protein
VPWAFVTGQLRHSPWQNGRAERLIGSPQRECLDHVVVFGEQHLRHVLLLPMLRRGYGAEEIDGDASQPVWSPGVISLRARTRRRTNLTKVSFDRYGGLSQLSPCWEDGEVVATFRQPFDLLPETAVSAMYANAGETAKSAKTGFEPQHAL